MSNSSKNEINRHQQKLINAIAYAAICFAVGAVLLRQGWRHWTWAQDYLKSTVPGQRDLGSEYEYFARNYGIAGGGFVAVAVFNACLARMRWKRYVRTRRLYAIQCANCGYDLHMSTSSSCPECGHPAEHLRPAARHK